MCSEVCDTIRQEIHFCTYLFRDDGQVLIMVMMTVTVIIIVER